MRITAAAIVVLMACTACGSSKPPEGPKPDDKIKALEAELQKTKDELVKANAATDDIRRACDVLRPLYDQTNHVDGRVSIEVSPLLAFNTQETIAEARWLAWISKVGSAGWP